jgi:hypothetical protein
MLMCLSSCGSVGGEAAFCSWSFPILISDADSLSNETARQVLGHNLTWEKFCD